jgi:hypothetical protein
MVGLRVVA